MAPARPAAAGRVDHSRLARVVERCSDGWRVDYEAVRRSSDLAAYRREIAAVDPAALDPDERTAFWLNAHNATLLALVAERMPVATVREIDGLFDRARCHVGRRDVTLAEMRREALPGTWLAWAALSGAAVGSPPLRAYGGRGLAHELAANARRFLADDQRGARREGSRVRVSRVLLWSAGEAAPLPALPAAATRTLTAARPGRLLPGLRPLLPPALADARRLGFLPYDWSVNGG
jgi:hypothetical protein